jgi:Response regulator of the LytR/AlgR family
MNNDSIIVLIIEDEEIWAKALHEMLFELGFTIASTIDTIEGALLAIKKEHYDIALVDINLNGKNSGLEIGMLLNSTYKKPFIFITGSSDSHSLLEAAQARPSAYLTKPPSKASLFVTIQSAIQNFILSYPENTKVPTTDLVKQDQFFVKQGNHFKKIEWKNVLFLESKKNYTKVVSGKDKLSYLFRSSLQKTMQLIVPPSLTYLFVQINRAEIINISFIEEIDGNVIITPFKRFNITEKYLGPVKQKLNIIP